MHHPPTPQEVLLILVLSSWLNIALYTLEIVFCLRYFQRPARPLIHKIGVGLLVFADTVCTGAVLFDVCLVIGVGGIDFWSHKSFMIATIALVLQIIPTYLSAAISQLFLTNLFVVLMGSRLLGLPLVLLILVHASFVLVILHELNNEFEQVSFSWGSALASIATLNLGGMVLTTSSIGAISCAATDIIIAVCLAWKFWTMMGPKPELAAKSSKSRLRLVLILIVSSGAICAINTCAAMILVLRKSQAYDFLFACQGRVYALTLLGNFLLGTPARRDQTRIHLKTIGSQSVVLRLSPMTSTTMGSIRDLDSDSMEDVDGPVDSFARYDWIQFDDLAPSPQFGKGNDHRDSGSV
ncbi:hypothetical protein MSAN_00449500 [Mycena sanguinolenta]|uniref:DUF6534 domain-containing protein n=1 Tax=Mycena sanguinolenta TaxID=230812 RepID=A0A8H6ZDW9_9AGAR|nr:hypothetical protein MSAN_00449500 [Mycena sanguinolenta]